MLNENTCPSVLIDARRGRIRFHRELLSSLDDPQYILLMIDPAQRSLIVTPCEDGTPCAHKLQWSSNSVCEIYSRSFIRRFSLLTGLQAGQSYRFVGKSLSDKHAVIFDLRGTVHI